MVSLKGVTDKLPFGDSRIGMFMYGFGALQIVGMLTGKWNLIPGMGLKADRTYGNADSQYSDWAFSSQVKPGVGGIRFGGSDIQKTLSDGGIVSSQRLARAYPGAPDPWEYKATGWKDQFGYVKSVIAKLRV
jgi:hypothetical protein